MAFLVLDHVSKRFADGPRQRAVLDQISFRFPARGLFFLYGASGGGKSTLLNVLAGLETPDSGKVMFKGKPLSKKSDAYRRKSVAIVFQHHELLMSLTPLENIALPGMMIGESRTAAQHRALALMAHYGIAALAKRPLAALSGGEKQRIALLRALIKDPAVILADEPTGALDADNAMQVLKYLSEMADQRLVIIVTHDATLPLSYPCVILRLDAGHLTVTENRLGPWVDHALEPPDRPAKDFGFLRDRYGRRHLQAQRKSMIGSMVGLALAWLAVMTLNLYPQILKKLSMTYADAGSMTLSKTVTEAIDDTPLRLTRRYRPTYAEASQFATLFPDWRVVPDLSPILSEYPSLTVDGTLFTSCQFLPLESFAETRLGDITLRQGRWPASTFDQVVINEAAASLFSEDQSVALPTVRLAFMSQWTIGDETLFFRLTKDFAVAAVVTENTFLNGPRIFYDYGKAAQWLTQKYPETSAEPYAVSWFSLLSSDNIPSALTGYRYRVFIRSETSFDALYRLQGSVERGTPCFQIDSLALMARESLDAMASSLRIGVYFLISLTLGGSTLMFAMSVFGYLNTMARENAILRCLGQSMAHLRALYLQIAWVGAWIVAAGGWILGLCGELLLKEGVRYALGVDIVSSTLETVAALPILGLIAWVTSTLATALPLRLLAQQRISEELRDE